MFTWLILSPNKYEGSPSPRPGVRTIAILHQSVNQRSEYARYGFAYFPILKDPAKRILRDETNLAHGYITWCRIIIRSHVALNEPTLSAAELGTQNTLK